MKAIGQRIRECRKALGLTAEQVAEALGKDRATVYRYESSAIENLPTGVLEPLADVLQTTPAYLMGWEEAASAAPAAEEPEEELLFIARKMHGLSAPDRERLMRVLNAMFDETDD